jgi:hypothetical protein
MSNVVDLLVRLGHDDDAAVLIGAMRTRSSTVQPFGDEARRFEAASETLAGRLDAKVLHQQSDVGAAMSDNEVVAYVLSALDAPAVG